MNWLYKKNNNNSSVFQSIARDSSDNDYQRVFNNVISFTSASSWEDLLLKWIEGIKNNEVSGAELKVQRGGYSIPLFPGALVLYGGTSSTTHSNLVIKDMGGGINLALNKDTYVGNSPTPINITIPALSIQTSKTYKTANDDEPYIPKYRHVLFDKDGEIKKY